MTKDYLNRIQEKNRLRELEEKKRQESLLQRQRLLREKIILECKSNVKRPRSSSVTPEKKTEQDSPSYNQKQPSKLKIGIIEKTQLRRQKIVEENSKRFRDPEHTRTAQQLSEALPLQEAGTSKPQQPADPASRFIRLSRKNSTSPKQTVRLPMITPKGVKGDRWIGASMFALGTPNRDKRMTAAPNLSMNRMRYRPALGHSDKRDMSPSREVQKEQRRPAVTVGSSIMRKNMELVSKISKNSQYVTSIKDWLKRNKLDPTTKVFIVSPNYPDIKEALESRGWVENPDYSSDCYHFKFAVKCADVVYDQLQSFQIVNHFEKAANITTKSGLCRSVKNMVWSSSEDQDCFFPKCFDLAEEADYDDFVIYYRQVKAETLLKQYLKLVESNQTDCEHFCRLNHVLSVCLQISQRRLLDIDEIADYPGEWTECSDKEWEALKAFDRGRFSRDTPPEPPAKLKKAEKNFKIASKKAPLGFGRSSTVVVGGGSSEGKAANQGPQIEQKMPVSLEERTGMVRQVLGRLRAKYPQTLINGDSNIWIVKPARLSRGRGIRLFDNFPDIFGYTKARDPNWVVQKYMENPLLYQGRKLDLRQWVIVTDWNPLTIWFYQECYIRLSTSPYDLSNIANRFSHLTNNSVNKNAKNFEAEASFLSQQAFAEYLKTYPAAASSNPFYDCIQPKMKDIVVKTFLCVQDMVENRKNSAEMYGFDFCIDDNLNVWLIEVNASPAWDYSSVTSDKTERHRAPSQAGERRLCQSHGRLQPGEQEEQSLGRHRHVGEDPPLEGMQASPRRWLKNRRKLSASTYQSRESMWTSRKGLPMKPTFGSRLRPRASLGSLL